MSRGPGKLQRMIVGLLDGSIPTRIYNATSGEFTTREFADELEEAGVLSIEDRKIARFTVRRACRSLVERGLLRTRLVLDADYPHTQTASWRLAPKPKARR